jgi:hypothetical protein
VVVVGGGVVGVCVDGVVFVTSTWVVVVLVDEEELDVFELDDDELLLDEEEVELGAEFDRTLGGGVAEEVVPSVATCSNRTGGRSTLRLLVTPTPNNAATAAPTNAPTASRNGAPL